MLLCNGIRLYPIFYLNKESIYSLYVLGYVKLGEYSIGFSNGDLFLITSVLRITTIIRMNLIKVGLDIENQPIGFNRKKSLPFCIFNHSASPGNVLKRNQEAEKNESNSVPGHVWRPQNSLTTAPTAKRKPRRRATSAGDKPKKKADTRGTRH